MGKIFTLTAGVKQIAQDAIDDLIDQLGKHCVLYYPPKMVACANCIYDPIGKKSSNRWVTGGPVPFADATCPLCNGDGKLAEQVTETITMLIAWSPANFFIKGPAGVEVPDGIIQTKGYLSDAPKIMKAREMVLEPEVGAMFRWRFVLAGELADVGNIIQGRYVVAKWKRAG